MDELDRKILRLLIQDARIRHKEIAKELRISTSTAFYRLKKLFDDGIITKIAPVISDKALGIQLTAIVLLSIEKENLIELEKSIAHKKNICAVYDITGDYDALIIGKFMNKEELDHFIKELRNINGIKRTNTSIVLNTIKEDFVFREL